MKPDKPLAFRIGPIRIEEVIEKSFLAGSEAAEREDVTGLKPIAKARIKERARLRGAAKHLTACLSRLEASIPPRSKLDPFYVELLDILGAGRLEEARLAIARARAEIRTLADRATSKLLRAPNPAAMQSIRKTAYGRMSARARSLAPCLDYLAELAPKLKEVPAIKFGIPTVVIAGYPNVGKTTLLKALTGSAPEIRPFPFTTKTIQLGYYESHWKEVQVIDTPGLLDRPMEKKNPIELKAIEAIKHLAHVIVFIVDPTTTCGFLLDEQIALLRQIKQMFPAPIVVTINKADIASAQEIQTARTALGDMSPLLEISSSREEGVPALRQTISSYLIEMARKLEG